MSSRGLLWWARLLKPREDWLLHLWGTPWGGGDTVQAGKPGGQHHGLCDQPAQVPFLASSLPSFVALGKLFNRSAPPFLFCKMGLLVPTPWGCRES